MPQGTFSDTNWVIGEITGSTSDLTTSVTAGQYLRLWGGAPFNGKIGGIQVYARATGSGAGSTIVDVLINGATIWPINTSNKPTLAAASIGNFVSLPPDLSTFKRGDIIDIQVASVPAVSGHRGVSCIVTLERPHGGPIIV